MTAKINYNLEGKTLCVEDMDDGLVMAKQGDRLVVRPKNASGITLEVKNYLDVRVYGKKNGKGGLIKIGDLGRRTAFYKELMKPGSTVNLQYDGDRTKTTDVTFE